MRRLIESMDSISKAAKKPTGPKFPGYWKGEEPASKSRSRMVGEESVIKELHNTTTSIEYKLQEALNDFKQQFGAVSPEVAKMSGAEVNKQIGAMAQNAATASGVAAPVAKTPAYTGIDPVVRQRMGMQSATQDEIRNYLDKNPPGLQTSAGQAVTTGTGAPVRSGGQVDVARAADQASPDRAAAVARPPVQPTQPAPAAATSAPAQPAAVASQPAPAQPGPAISPSAAVPTNIPPAQNTAPAAQAQAAAPTKTPAPYRGNQGAREIQAANPSIKDVNKIQPGQRLKLPDSDKDYVVQRGDTLDKIGKMFRSGEIGGRVVGGDGPMPTAAVRPQAAPASTATPVSGPQPPAAPATKPAPAAPAQPAPQSAASIKAQPAKTSANPTVKLGFGDPGYTPIIGNKLEKRSDGKWYYAGSGNTPVRPDVAKYAETQLARQAGPAGTATKPPAGAAGSSRTTPGGSSFADLVGYAETGNKNIPNQTGSSAAGVYGFMPAAFKGFVDAAKPGDPLYGKTWNDYLTDLNVQDATMRAQEKDINYQLAKNNIEPNVGNKYLMHFLGGPTAVPVMKALEKDPKTPLSTWFGRDPYPDVAIADTPAAFNKFKQSNPGHPISKLDYNQYRNSRPAVYRQNPQLSRENIRTVGDISDWSNRKMKRALGFPALAPATTRDAIAAGSQKNEAVNKLAEQFAAFMEAQDQYGPEYQAMVQRVGQRAKQGPLKTVWDPVKRVYKNVPVKQEKPVKEYENAQDQDSQVTSPPSPDATAASKQFVTDKELQNMNAQRTLEADAGAQDPNKQITSPPSPAAAAKPATPAPAAPDVSVATAKTTMAGLKPALGPDVDTNAAATGVTKANLGQQLTPAEQQAVGALTPLVMKAATIPSAAPQLRSALTNAGTIAKSIAAKQGKM